MPAAHYLAKLCILHCVLAQQSDIVGTALVVRVHESVRIGVGGLQHLQFLGFGVHLADESIVALHLHKLGSLCARLSFHKLATAPNCKGSAGVVATWKHKPQEELSQSVNFATG